MDTSTDWRAVAAAYRVLLQEAVDPPPMPAINTKGKINADLDRKMRLWRELSDKAVEDWCRTWEGRVREALAAFDVGGK